MTGGASSLLGFLKGAVSSAEPAAAGEAAGEEGAAAPKMKNAATSTSSSPSRPPVSPTPLQQQQFELLQQQQPRGRSDSVDSESSINSTGLRGWWARASSGTSSSDSRRGGPRPLMVGDRVSAGQWGEAVVLRVREGDAMVEVAFTRWRGRAFLHKSVVKPC